MQRWHCTKFWSHSCLNHLPVRGICAPCSETTTRLLSFEACSAFLPPFLKSSPRISPYCCLPQYLIGFFRDKVCSWNTSRDSKHENADACCCWKKSSRRKSVQAGSRHSWRDDGSPFWIHHRRGNQVSVRQHRSRNRALDKIRKLWGVVEEE